MPYVMAILIVGATAVLTRLLWGFSSPAPAALFLIAVAISAFIGGTGPGLTAAIASSFAVIGLILLLGDLHDVNAGQVLWILSLLPVALMIGLLQAGRARAQEALVERDARLQLISDQIPGGLWSTDAHLHFTSGFGAQSGLLHGPPGTSLYEHFNTTDATFAPIAAHRRALRGESNNYELQWAGRTFQSYVEPLRGINGEIIGVVGVAADITDRKRAEQQIAYAKQQLESANQAKDRFLAMLSHELRTPLAPVLALASDLVDRKELPMPLRLDLETIRRNVALEATLIDDLLDLTRISRGKLQLTLQDVDAHELLNNALEICRPEGQAKQIEIELRLDADQHFVRADAARLQQVFWNLLKNAIKFTPAGGRVRIVSSNPGNADGNGEGQLRVEVSDTGIGIAPDLLPRIFDAFEQGAVSITREFGGLGLGLAISKALIEAHHGQISAASDGPGAGACFAVALANVQPATLADRDAADPAHATLESALKILLVEDHPDTAVVMQRLLNDSGHEVQTAGSVAAALQRLEQIPVDIVISDIGLPDGSGLDLIRELCRRRPVKAIALSGYGTEEDVQRSLAAGFAAHLTKPVPMSTLRKTIAEVASCRV
jgi:signal transduction histidine kinase/CheY-like chemotaxis protein